MNSADTNSENGRAVEHQLKTIRSRQRFTIGAVLVWLVGGMLIGSLSDDSPWVLFPWIFGGAFFSVFSMARWGGAKCPRCGKGFFIRENSWGNPYTRSCMNCGLPLRT